MSPAFVNLCSTPKDDPWVDRYRSGAWRTGVEPNDWFCSPWYAWQNPGWVSHASPFDHYVDKGCAQQRDPSPMVDFHQFSSQRPRQDPHDAYRDLLTANGSIAQGVYRSFADLHEVQTEALAQLRPLLLGNRLETHRRFLVIVQNHASPRIDGWTRTPDRTFDLWVNYYSSQSIDTDLGDVSTFQVGTKFTGILKLLETYPELLEPYDYILLLDDDIEVDVATLDAAFAETTQLNAGMSQMRLTPESHCVWPTLKSTRPEPIRLNTVEIMMPIVSREMLAESVPYLRECLSGFGLDLAWGAIAARRNLTSFLLQATAEHHKPIDQAGGAYYNFLRSFHLNAKTELWHAMGTHAFMPSIREYGTDPSEAEALALETAIASVTSR